MDRKSLAVLLLATLAASTRASDWPGLLGPTRDGQSTETGLHWNWGKTGPAIAWSIDVGSGNAGPIVQDGTLFLFHRVADEDLLIAANANTGKLLWTFQANARGTEGPQVAPLFADGRIFTLSYGGKLHAVDAKTGAKVWMIDLMKEYSPPEGYFGVGAGLLHLNGKLIVNVGGKAAGIVAFDTATGKEAWKATNDPPSYSTPTQMTLDDKPHAVVFTRTGLVVVNAETGAVKFTQKHRAVMEASVNAATPLVWKNEVFLTAQYGTGATLLKLLGDGPALIWANDTSLSCQYNTPVWSGNCLYGVHGRQDGGAASLVCVEWATGAVKWSQPRFGVAHLIAVDAGMLALNERGELIRFAASEKEYTEQARGQVLDGLTRAAPALANKQLFLRNEKKLIAVKLSE
jgi:outer membrane protein assembly factor BamB